MPHVENYDPNCSICRDIQDDESEPSDYHDRICRLCDFDLMAHHWAIHPHEAHYYRLGVRCVCLGWSETIDDSFED